jgi:hypothetical protein
LIIAAEPWRIRKYPFQDTKPFNLLCQVRREERKDEGEI